MRGFTDYESMAMFDLVEAERLVLAGRFDIVVDGFSALDGYDTSEVEPLVSVLDVPCVLRDDVSMKIFSRDEVLRNAPESHDGYFQVPATIE